jgi:hypothetical protein
MDRHEARSRIADLVDATVSRWLDAASR